MKPNPFVVTSAPKDAAPGPAPRPELLQQAFAKELLEFGPAVFLADLRGEVRWSNAAYRKIAETKIGNGKSSATIGQALPLKDIAEEIDVKRQPLFREDTISSGTILRSRHVPLFDERGQLTGFGGMLNLSTETAERGEENPLVLERHMDFIRLSSDWMWETDAEFNLQMVTHRISNVLGFSPHELIGKNLMSMVSSEPLRQALRRRMERLSPFRDQPFDAEDNTGRRKLFVMSAAPVFDKADGSLKGYRGAATDITELTRREESLRTAKEAAEIASRAKSHFLANMSHELRTPLNAIIGFTDVMRMGLLGPVENPEYRSYVSDIHGSAQRLLEVINDILDMSKIEAGGIRLAPEEVDLDTVLSDSLRVVSQKANEKTLKLVSQIDPAILLTADRRALKQIALNLLSNAVKFTPEGGSVTVRGHVRGDAVVIAIEDNGIGIPKNALRKLGRPFEQVESQLTKKYQGSGLGLAIAKSLTEMHGGAMRIRSALGKGTSVVVRLPLVARLKTQEESIIPAAPLADCEATLV
jgi:PAS domain S-box-containing protein